MSWNQIFKIIDGSLEHHQVVVVGVFELEITSSDSDEGVEYQKTMLRAVLNKMEESPTRSYQIVQSIDAV